MAKVNFKRCATNDDLNNIDIVDGNFIVTGQGQVFVDYNGNRIAVGGTPDIEMSDSSINPVQNKIIKLYVDDKNENVLSNLGLLNDTYSNEDTYSADDIVIKDNKIYKCITAIPIPEEFDETKWELTSIIDNNKINNELIKDVYSTIETKTNKIWIDGKPIYRKVFTGTVQSFQHLLTNVNFVNAWGFYTSSTGAFLPLPSIRPDASQFDCGFYVTPTQVVFAPRNPISGNFVIVLEYTKE